MGVASAFGIQAWQNWKCDVAHFRRFEATPGFALDLHTGIQLASGSAEPHKRRQIADSKYIFTRIRSVAKRGLEGDSSLQGRRNPSLGIKVNGM